MTLPSHQPRTLSIGGATEDLFVKTPSDVVGTRGNEREMRFASGSKIRVEEVIEAFGGGASNTAVGLQRLGCSAHFCGTIGSDQWGERILANFRKEGVDTRALTVVEDETSGFSIILHVQGGERIILYAPGTNVHLHDATFDRETALSMDWLYLNNIHERSCVIHDDLIGILMRTPDAPGLTWNPGGSCLEAGMEGKKTQALLAATDILLLNKEEALTFTRMGELTEAIRVLLQTGVRIVCVTDGKRGVTAGDGTSLCTCAAIEDAPVIDTTGAGDAFGTGATWALLLGLDLPTILRAGTIHATSVIGSIGAQTGLLTHIEMRRRLAATPLDIRVTPLPC